MAQSSVYYRFSSQKEPTRIRFDGTGISVWDLKKEIILSNKMGKGTDFDIKIYDASSEEEYKDDNFVVPRSTSVLVRRLPPARGFGRGTAQNYVAAALAGAEAVASPATGSASSANSRPMAQSYVATPSAGASTKAPVEEPLRSTASGGDEASRIAAMFQATTDQWNQTQERMAHVTPVFRGGAPRNMGRRPGPSGPPVPDRPPPPGYICYRCGQKGHWIQQCPTNDNEEFDNRPRIKRTTGIPRSFLKQVEQPSSGSSDAAKPPSGVMVTPDGSYVIAQPDSASWERNRSRAAAAAKALTRAEVYQLAPSESDLACPLCGKLAREATKTPCCGTTYCEECIQTYLLEHDFVCPECEKRVEELDRLIPDEEKRELIEEYVEREIEKSKEVEEAESEEEEEKGKEKEKEKESGKEKEKEKEKEIEKGSEEKTEKVEAEARDNETDEQLPPPLQQQQQPQPPGSSGGGNFNPQVAQMQMQMSQMMMALQNPTVPPPMKMQIQMQVQALWMQMQQVGRGMGMQMPQMGMPMPMSMPMPMPMPQMGMGMGMPMGMNAMNAVNAMNGAPPPMPEYRRTNWTPPQVPAGEDSPYMRLPVNPRKRGNLKRARPTDFTSIAGGDGGPGSQKQARQG